MKAKTQSLRRQLFVFTPSEKRAGACVAAALLVGLTTMHYRSAHPQIAKLTPKQEFAAKRAGRAANARARSAHGREKLVAAQLTTPVPNESDENE